MRIYLAGTIRRPWGEWLGEAIQECYPDRYYDVLDRVEFLDPASHGLRDECEYTAWDLLAVRSCDVLLAFMSEENPSGYGICVEVGYAKALGKTVVFVDRTSERHKYFGMVRSAADVVVGSLNEAARFIVKLIYL